MAFLFASLPVSGSRGVGRAREWAGNGFDGGPAGDFFLVSEELWDTPGTHGCL
jgi:hypothetical protein